jgi:hypothetical protein
VGQADVLTVLDLEDVTLVYISDAEDIPISTLSVRENMRHANFGDVLLFSDVPWGGIRGAHHVRVAPLRSDIGPDPVHAIGTAMCCLWYVVPKYITTKFALIAQWDSWIINPQRWTEDFLAYDYIGGPWHKKRQGQNIFEVGNGGFSIRSARLMQHVAAYPDLYPLTYPRFEDGVLCRDHKTALETAGFTWAPVHLAAEFSFEGAGEPNFDLLTQQPGNRYLLDFNISPKPFAFHALRNFHHVMSREQAMQRLGLVRASVRRSNDYVRALQQCRALSQAN